MANAEYIATKREAAQRAGFMCVEAEENILRRMILRQGVAEDVVTELVQGDFADIDYGKLFGAIQSLVFSHKQVNMISVDAEMTRIHGVGGWKPETDRKSVV